MADLKQLVADHDAILWGLAFTGVCVLVALGKLKPETIEYMLFALVGKASTKKAVVPDA